MDTRPVHSVGTPEAIPDHHANYDFPHEREPHMLTALRYYWHASKGYRLRPWRSPYLRWRMETFFGPEADSLTAPLFFHLLWRERRRLQEFMLWIRDYRAVR